MRLATLSTWRGYPLWKCALCGHTDTDRRRFDRHIGQYHRVKATYTIPDVSDEEAPAEAEQPTTDEAEATGRARGRGRTKQQDESPEPPEGDVQTRASDMPADVLPTGGRT